MLKHTANQGNLHRQIPTNCSIQKCDCVQKTCLWRCAKTSGSLSVGTGSEIFPLESLGWSRNMKSSIGDGCKRAQLEAGSSLPTRQRGEHNYHTSATEVPQELQSKRFGAEGKPRRSAAASEALSSSDSPAAPELPKWFEINRRFKHFPPLKQNKSHHRIHSSSLQ